MMRVLFAIAAALACGLTPPAMAQSWPTQPVKIIVPYSPGTGMDILARTIGPRLGEMWHQPVVVENKPGASGNLGGYLAAKSAPDGHTLMMGANTLIINTTLYQNMSYNPITDLAPVGLAANASMMLVTHPKTAITTVRDLVAQAKEHPGALNYASPGIATPHHMAMELFRNRAGINLTHIPFSATGPALTQLLGGEIPVMFLPVHVAIPHVKAGKLNALATGGAARSPFAPDVPTLDELGYKDLDTDVWYALWAPGGTPAPLVARINADMQKVLTLPEVRASLAQQGMEVLTSTPEQMRERIASDAVRWAQVVKAAGIKAE